MNRRQAHFESVLKAGGRIAGPKMADAVSPTDIFGDSEGCLSRSKQEHSELAASALFDSPIL